MIKINLTTEFLEVGVYKPHSVTILKDNDVYTLQMFFIGMRKSKNIKRKGVDLSLIKFENCYNYQPDKYNFYKHSKNIKGNYINFYEIKK